MHANNLAEGSQTGARSFSQQSSIFPCVNSRKELLTAVTLEIDGAVLPIRGSCGDQQTFLTL